MLIPRPHAVDEEAARIAAAVPFIDFEAPSPSLSVPADLIIDLSGADALAVLAPRLVHGVWRLSAYEPEAGLRTLSAGDAFEHVTLDRAIGDPLRRERVNAADFSPKFLLGRHRDFIREKSVRLLMQSLRRLARSGRAEASAAPDAAPVRHAEGSVSAYTARAARGVAARLLARAQAHARLRPDMWRLQSGFGGLDSMTLDAGSPLTPRGDRIWADPFLHRREGVDYVFYEDMDYASARGRISVGRFGSDGFEELGPALATPYHLSFPYVFACGGDLFMMPETHQTRRIEVWRCRRFPFEWELHATALEGAICADSLLVDMDGTWRLFTALTDDSFGDLCSELHIFTVDGPDLRTLAPHPLNPVVIGSDSARNAGRIFRQDGAWFRPAQESAAGVYGRALRIMRIEALSDDRYVEREVFRLDPGGRRDVKGVHHFDRSGDRWIIDVCMRLGGRPGRRAG